MEERNGIHSDELGKSSAVSKQTTYEHPGIFPQISTSLNAIVSHDSQHTKARQERLTDNYNLSPRGGNMIIDNISEDMPQFELHEKELEGIMDPIRNLDSPPLERPLTPPQYKPHNIPQLENTKEGVTHKLSASDVDNLKLSQESTNSSTKSEEGSKTHNLSLSDLPPEEAKFYIMDKDSGTVYDIRSGTQMQKLTQQSEKLNKIEKLKESQKAKWEIYWKHKDIINEEFRGAAENGEINRVRKFLDVDRRKDMIANVNSVGLDNWTALHFAASEGHFEVAEMIVGKSPDLDSKTKMGRSALHISSVRGNHMITNLLVQNGSDVNSIDDENSTPLHLASEYGNMETLNIILTKNPDITIRNNNGQTPADVAQNYEIFDTLQKYIQASMEYEGEVRYSRTPFYNTLRHNARTDNVKKILYQVNRQERIEQRRISESANGGPFEEKKKNKDREDRKRKIKIQQVEDASTLEGKSKIPKKSPTKDRKSLKKLTEEILNETESSGQTVGPEDFEALTMIGKGAFGEVHLVRHNETGKLYALKMLLKRQIQRNNLTKYARSERDVLSYTKHPFIVGLHFAFQTNEKLFLLLEYCPGGDLRHVLDTYGKFKEERARLYAAEVLLALEDLHKRDIIFRDLKPDNIVIDAQGHTLLTDFGLSKEGVKDNKMADTFCGSVAYMAPEILNNQGHGKSVDWYLFGVVIYEMLVGEPPYFTNDRQQLFKNIKRAPLKVPLRLSKDAQALLSGLLNRNPNKRLGARGDAKEIKSQPWFKDINWQDVFDKKLVPPKPRIKPIPRICMSNYIFEDNAPRTTKNVVKGWEFVSEEAKTASFPSMPNEGNFQI